MPKITHAADGPTHHIGQTQDESTASQFIVTRTVVGGERPSLQAVGGNSSASSKSDETPNESSSVSLREPVPTTENLSRQDHAESSSVASTAGNGQETESQPFVSRRTTKKAATPRKARTTAIHTDEFEDDNEIDF